MLLTHVSKSLLMFASFLVITWKVFEDSKLYSNMMHTDTRSAILVACEILVRKLQVEDTEDY